MMKKFLLIWIITLNVLLGNCFINNNPSDIILIQTLKENTTTMLSGKENELKEAVKLYKEALEKKKEMMEVLWKTVTEVEFIMKENQISRKAMIDYWKYVKQSHTTVQSY